MDNVLTDRWSTIARYLPGRTDNEIKNYWRTHFKKMKPKREAQMVVPQPDNKTSPPISFEQDREEKDMMKPYERDNDELGMVFTEPAAMAADQSYLSMVYEDFATWAAAAAAEESYLWGGLWEDSNNLL